MRPDRCALLALVALVATACSAPRPAPTTTTTTTTTAAVARPPGADPRIAEAVSVVDREHFARDVEALALAHEAWDPATASGEARAYVVEQLRAAGYDALALQPVPFGVRREFNVIAERAGSDPSRVVIACAHYDAVRYSPGADDNASGAAGVLAVARAAARLRTRATVRVVAFALEEDEQRGSRVYVDALPPPERERIAGVFNLEMIGYTDPRPGAQQYPDGFRQMLAARTLPDTGDFIGALGLVTLPAPMEALGRARSYVPGLRTVGVPVASAVALLVPDLLRSDHASFWAAGLPAVMVTDTSEFRNPNYHRETDTVQSLDLEFGARAARWVAAAVLTLAEGGGG